LVGPAHCNRPNVFGAGRVKTLPALTWNESCPQTDCPRPRRHRLPQLAKSDIATKRDPIDGKHLPHPSNLSSLLGTSRFWRLINPGNPKHPVRGSTLYGQPGKTRTSLSLHANPSPHSLTSHFGKRIQICRGKTRQARQELASYEMRAFRRRKLA